jgi:hypothetical protein
MFSNHLFNYMFECLIYEKITYTVMVSNFTNINKMNSSCFYWLLSYLPNQSFDFERT